MPSQNPRRRNRCILTGSGSTTLCSRVFQSTSVCRTEAGNVLPMAVAVGDRVLLPEFGGAKVWLEILKSVDLLKQCC